MYFAVENFSDLVEEQPKKRIALTVRPAWIEKTPEYARQILFPFVEEVEHREAGRGPPVKFGLGAPGYSDGRAETGEESLQIGGVGTRRQVRLVSEALEKSRQPGRVARHIPFRVDHHASRQCEEILGRDYTRIWQSTEHRPDKSLTIPEKVLTADSARECGLKAGPAPDEERDTAVSDRDGGPGLGPEPERVELDLRL